MGYTYVWLSLCAGVLVGERLSELLVSHLMAQATVFFEKIYTVIKVRAETREWSLMMNKMQKEEWHGYTSKTDWEYNTETKEMETNGAQRGREVIPSALKMSIEVLAFDLWSNPSLLCVIICWNMTEFVSMFYLESYQDIKKEREMYLT